MSVIEVNQERWQLRGNTYWCRVHEVEFARGEVCIACADDPGDQVDTEPGQETESDRELALRESEWRQLSKKLRREAEAIFESGVAREFQTAAKLICESTKLERLAADNREKRAQREHERMLVRHEREMAGLRGSH